MSKRRVGLCVSPILLFLIDISLTLWHQPSGYWAGDYATAIESSPEVRRVMQTHPALLFLMIAVWIGVIVLLVRLLPRTLAEIFSVSTAIAHTACASSWLHPFPSSYQLTIALSICAGCLVVMSLHADRSAVPENQSQWGIGAWSVAAFLLLVIAYVTLYPH
jgi:hypothetical protein